MNTILSIGRHIFRDKTPLISSIIAGAIAGAILLELIVPQTVKAIILENYTPVLSAPTIIKNGHLTICKLDKNSYEIIKKIKMIITAYSSTPEQTDSTPFITASGKNVADGIVANNMLPFGAKIRIPEVYGDKVFTVEDRMHQRKGNYHLDIWFPEYLEAKNFGAKITYIEVLEN